MSVPMVTRMGRCHCTQEVDLMYLLHMWRSDVLLQLCECLFCVQLYSESDDSYCIRFIAYS